MYIYIQHLTRIILWSTLTIHEIYMTYKNTIHAIYTTYKNTIHGSIQQSFSTNASILLLMRYLLIEQSSIILIKLKLNKYTFKLKYLPLSKCPIIFENNTLFNK